MNLDRIINLIKRTGDRCIVVDKNTGENFVLMSLDEYEHLILMEPDADMVSDAAPARVGANLIDEVNRDVAHWRARQNARLGEEVVSLPEETDAVHEAAASAFSAPEPEVIPQEDIEGIASKSMESMGPTEIAGFSRITFEHLPPKFEQPDAGAPPAQRETEGEENVEFKWEPIE